MRYPVKTPIIFRMFMRHAFWRFPVSGKTIFLTFDDGPSPEATPHTLDILAEAGAKATFFVTGYNSQKHPGILKRIVAEGHAVGNHTHTHVNGWQTPPEEYFENTQKAKDIIQSVTGNPVTLFRPPYGRITRKQYHHLKNLYKIIMWDVLSGDFDPRIDGRKIQSNTLESVRPGSIVVFHDSTKWGPRMNGELPAILASLREQQYEFGAIS